MSQPNQPNQTPTLDFKKPKTDPYLDVLPEYLKDPKNYDKIRKVLYDVLAGGCKNSHEGIEDWAKCVKCQQRFSERSHLIKKLGFPSARHYLHWQRTMDYIAKKLPLLMKV